MAQQPVSGDQKDVDVVEVTSDNPERQQYSVPLNTDEPVVTRKELWSYYCMCVYLLHRSCY